ncbi:hypothetical protein PEP31012_01427 [Pandoraea eparura]|jgi:hypothetical protein|uniref:Uncharacterized protein n=1 Tax=Pandoraea eparura TaxID=2508291 RepID=A0A5E4THA0_9BURK|nr:hypothetical protein PEP31012_01427 [Pandoraea eparura]
MTMPLTNVCRPVVPHSFGAARVGGKTQWRTQERRPMMCGSGDRPMTLSH